MSSSKFAGLGLAVTEARRMPILHPATRDPMFDENGDPAYIDLMSADSAEAKKHERVVTQRRLDIAAAKRGRGVSIKPQAAQIEAETIVLYVTLTKGWHLADLDGKVIDLPLTTENAHDLYVDNAVAWLVEQVDAFVFDRANFTPASSTNS